MHSELHKKRLRWLFLMLALPLSLPQAVLAQAGTVASGLMPARQAQIGAAQRPAVQYEAVRSGVPARAGLGRGLTADQTGARLRVPVPVQGADAVHRHGDGTGRTTAGLLLAARQEGAARDAADADTRDWVHEARRASRQHLPVWELGVGLSAISLPDYRGADTGRRYVLPFPVFVYRAPHLRMDRNGLRADLWDDARFELDVSVGLSAPVRSDPNGIRAGMPRQRALFEIGPRLLVHLWSGNRGRQRVQLQLPLRHAMPLGRLSSTGWLFSPNLTMQIDDVAGLRGWQFSTWAGPLFGSRGFHEYFYRVEAAHARAGRPAYSPRGGYGGMQFAMALNKRYPDFWVAGFVRADDVRGAVFAGSPLVQRRTTLTAGLVVGWLLLRSAQQVEQTD
ncbi:MAG: MipA/OmpV family protein [Lautropia sp.]|nr:MipA/OmpV family protein [Lautropia sp.]